MQENPLTTSAFHRRQNLQKSRTGVKALRPELRFCNKRAESRSLARPAFVNTPNARSQLLLFSPCAHKNTRRESRHAATAGRFTSGVSHGTSSSPLKESIPTARVLSPKYLTIRPPIHPVLLRWADLPRSEAPCETGDSTAEFRQLISRTEH